MDTVQIQRGDNSGIVECLRAVIRPTMPAKQADLLYGLRDIANTPGFSREALINAINYLLEANAIVSGGPPSEWGLKARMREKME